MKTIIQSRKTRSFTYRQQCGEAALNFLPFLMCFSLPDSNSFPGPRQLHINWPRRRCQGCSGRVLWCCHLQLNTDLEVYSCSLHQLSLLSFFFSLSPFSLISLFLCFVCVFPFLSKMCVFSQRDCLSSSSSIRPPSSCVCVCVPPSPSLSPLSGCMEAAAGPDLDQRDIH